MFVADVPRDGSVITMASRHQRLAWICAALALAAGGSGRHTASADQLIPRSLPPLALESLGGRESFQFYCAPCHGADGRGAGPTAAALKTRPADLTTLARRNDGAYPRERVHDFVTGAGRPLAAHGSRDMPVWGPIFRGLDPSDARVAVRVDNIVGYVESLQAPSTGVNDAGSQLFRTYCSSCHGTTARGNGPLAESLRHMPPDLTTYTARNGGVFPSERLRRIVDGRDVPTHGDREMPVWGDAFTATRGGSSEASIAARIAAILKYLEGIQVRSGD